MLLAVRISSYGCTWEVSRALKKLELLSCSPNFSRAFITRYTHAKHEPILKCEAGAVIDLLTKSTASVFLCSRCILKGKYHENLLSFPNPKMFVRQQKQKTIV